MRNFALCLAVLCLVAGCTRWNLLKGPDTNAKTDGGPAPPLDKLVNYLNDNSSRIDTLRCAELDMTCEAGFQRFGLRGMMLASKPHNFRMKAEVFGKTEVDLGSNDDEFWYWIARNKPPYQFFCSYKDLAGGRVGQIPFPFQPDWIVEAMGMGKYGPPERYKLEVDGSHLKLVEKAVSPQGKPVRKVIVMNRKPMRTPHPQVTAFLLVDDATGQEICSAHITETQLVGKTSGILPRRIEFRWTMPDQTLKLAMTLDGIAVNSAIPPATFARQPLQGIPSYDLASGRLDRPASLQQVKGIDKRP